MKKTIYTLSVLLIISCNQQNESNKIWTVEFDTVSSSFYMKETNSLKYQTLNQVIEMLNEQNPQIQIELGKTSNDTAYVKIENSDFLTSTIS